MNFLYNRRTYGRSRPLMAHIGQQSENTKEDRGKKLNSKNSTAKGFTSAKQMLQKEITEYRKET